jgi:hypothetical protein
MTILDCYTKGAYKLRQQIHRYQTGTKLSKQEKRLELVIKLCAEMSLQNTEIAS